MMYEYIVATLRDAYCGKDASQIREHVAIQFNVWGEGHGALYLEIADGVIHVEPYEYYDRDTIVYTDAETLLAIAAGKVDPVHYGDLYVEGDRSKLEILRDISMKPAEETAEPESAKKPEKKQEKKPAKRRTAKKKTKSRSGKAAAAGEKVLKTAEEAAKTAKGAAKTAKGAAKTAKETAEEVAGEVAKTARGAAESVKGRAGTVKEKAGSVKKKAEDVVHSIRKDN